MRLKWAALLPIALVTLNAASGAFAAQTATAAPAAAAAAAPAEKAPPKPTRWEKTIAGFENRDKQAPPPKGAVLFIGSSSIVKWKSLAKDFPNVPTLNRGFGGSIVGDSTYYADRIVIPYRPRRIVFYAGDNDLAAGLSPKTVAADFAEFVMKVRASLPDVPIVYISIKPSPSRWRLKEQYEETNKLIEAWCAKQKDVTFVDVYHAMLGEDGQPRPELFVADKLHMTPAGYAIWTKILTPYVK